MTDIFILKELRKLRWLTARLQIWGGRRDGCHAGGGGLPARVPQQPVCPRGALARLWPTCPLWGSRGEWPGPQLFLARGHSL